MSSGITQLIAIGAQDIHLTSNPEISFYRSAYKRHTNFSMFQSDQVIRGSPGPGSMSSVNISRKGDLLSYMFVTATNSSGITEHVDEWTEYIESFELVIGGQVIDKHDISFLEELSVDLFATNYSKSYAASLHSGHGNDSMFLPLRFFFCEAWQSALPIIALQYHDVEIKINWAKDFSDNDLKFNFTCNYIALDVDERKFFVDNSRDILIFQVQKSPASQDKIHEINFNHPVKYLCSSNVDNGSTDNNLCSSINYVKCLANGNEITERKLVVPHYTTVPSYYHTEFSVGNINTTFLVPFCLSTCKLQPTGTLNFSRLDSFFIHSDLPITRPIYGVNYNILSIKNGMAGLVYSN